MNTNSIKIYSIAICAIFYTLSCSKDKSTEITVEPEPVCKVTDYTSNWYMGERKGNDAKTEFTYDAKNRIVIGSANYNPMSFEYYDDKVIVKYFVFEEPYVSFDEYSLNNKGYAMHMVRKMYSYFDTELKTYMTLDFEYDSSDRLTAIKEGDKSVNFLYEGDNLVQIDDQISGKKVELTYYNDQSYFSTPLFTLSPFYHVRTLVDRSPSPVNQTIPLGVLYAGGYLGKPVKNQFKSIDTYNFTYTKDDKGKIIHLKEVNTSESIDSMVYNLNFRCE